MLAAACLLSSTAAMAGDRVPVEDFARHSQLSMPQLSPDGKHLAVNMNYADGNSHALAVYDVADMSQPVSLLRLPKYELALGISWVSNTRLVVEKGRTPVPAKLVVTRDTTDPKTGITHYTIRPA